MALKIFILLGMLLGPAGSQPRRESPRLDPQDTASPRRCLGVPTADRNGAFAAVGESPLDVIGWFTDTEDDLTEEGHGSASLPLDPDRFIRRSWDQFVSHREAPIFSQFVSRRIPLRC